MRRLRHIARLLLLFAPLGLATTVAVAWGFALRSPDAVSRVHTWTVDGDHPISFFAFEEYHALGMVRRGVRVHRQLVSYGPCPLSMRWRERELETPIVREEAISKARAWGAVWRVVEGDHDADRVDDARAWPFPALWSSWTLVREGGGASPPWAARLDRGIRIGPKPAAGTRDAYFDGAHYRALPLCPIWTGLLANATIYMVAWAAIIALVRWCRSWRRRRRGLCGGCGYDLRGDLAGGCPECGWRRAPLEPRA